jgi:LmbE family N-acetylglucosaminyl deacetylase
MKVLCIAAHPDDEVLGCGGTLGRLAAEGQEVFIAILGEGITSRYAQREHADSALLQDLQDHSRLAAKILGVQDVFLFNQPDNRFDTVPLLELAKIVEGLVQKLQPAVVFTQHGGDLNVDHQQVFRATLTGTRPMAGSVVRTVYAYEVPSSTEWAFGQFSPVFHPNTFFDISATLDAKVKAMQIYESEARAFPHPRSPESLRALALRWGAVAGLRAAEAFQLIRDIR